MRLEAGSSLKRWERWSVRCSKRNGMRRKAKEKERVKKEGRE